MPRNSPKPNPKGRGSHLHVPNRFETVRLELDLEQCPYDEELLAELDRCKTEYFADQSKSVVTENDSPDISFRYSLNPYRGCSHGCSYCYARPGHEYLGFNAGLDFETRVMVKLEAPELLRQFLTRPKWTAETIAMSGVTDCYQPAERQFRITRGCLEVALEARQPIGIITKNALVLRDLDLLGQMASMNLAHVSVSITTLDAELARTMEPRTSTPAARLRAVRELSAAGVPVRVMTAPIIPGLNDREIPALLEAAADAGAKSAAYTLLRLPLTVKPVFLEWLERTQPLARERIEGLILATHGGKYNDSKFGERMRGSGEIAEQIRKVFRVFAAKHHLDGNLPDYNHSLFRSPQSASGQMRLF
ncbi:MAG TPA: PA0069 family radical SAM protein [Pirellulales bacterium]|nr:PA0069 family radical SAM protein [Pirellulales bacterium]